MSNATDCQICCLGYTKQVRKCITCPHCSKKACVYCVKIYVLNFNGVPNCLYCKVGFGVEFITHQFNKSFLTGEYKKHRQNMLFSIEKAKIPDTVEFCEVYDEFTTAKSKLQKIRTKYYSLIELQQISKKSMISSIDNYHRHLVLENKECCTFEPCLENMNICVLKFYDIENELKDVRKTFTILSGNNYDLYIRNLRNYFYGVVLTRPVLTDDGRKEYCNRVIKECVSNNCNGFISSKFTCQLCDARICKDCFENVEKITIDGNTFLADISVNDINERTMHVCNEDTKSTIILIKSDTKPCPKCSALIYKIDGCDSMWCTQCKTSFSWKTGVLQTRGRIHNPEYFRFLRENNDEAALLQDNLEANEGEEDNCVFVGSARANLLFRQKNDLCRAIRIAYQRLLDIIIRCTNLPDFKFNGNITDPHRLDRVLYMKNQIGVDKFKSNIYAREKKILKITNNYQILSMFITVTDDLLKEALLSSVDNIDKLEYIRLYTNKIFHDKSIKEDKKQFFHIPDYKKNLNANVRNRIGFGGDVSYK